MQIISRSTVFHDPDPTSRMVNSAFPSIVALSDGRLLVSHRVGSHKDSDDGTLFISESVDGGQKWTGLGTPFETELNGVHGELRCGGITEIEPGRLIITMLWVDRSTPGAPMFNPETEGLLPVRILLAESFDGGRTWGRSRTLDTSPMIQAANTGPILKLPDGSLLCHFETNKHYDDPGPWHHQAAGIFSTDKGETWHDPTVFAADPKGRLYFWDQRPAVLTDGSMIDLFWTFDREAQSDLEIHVAWSYDSARTWSRPMPTGILGQIAFPIPLEDGRIMMVYVHRHDPPSLRALLSVDNGQWWDTDEELVFHDQGSDMAGAAEGDAEMKSYLQDMELWSFGLPSGVQLPDGDVAVVYYAGRGVATGIHVVRIAV